MKIDVIIPSLHSISGGNIYNHKVFSRLQNELSLHYTFLDSKSSIQVLSKIFGDSNNRIFLIDSLYVPATFKQFPEIFLTNKVIGLIHLPIGMDIDHATPEIKISEIAAYKACHHLICTSDFIKNQISKQYEIPEERIDIIRPGVQRLKKKTQFAELPKKLISISNLIGRKNIPLIIDSCSQIPHKEWSLDIFGRLDMDEHEANKIKKQTNTLGLSFNIHFKGQMDHEKVLKRLTDYDLLLFSSSFETFGMVVLESIQARLPYLSTQVGEFEYFNSFGIGIHAKGEPSYSSNLLELMSNNKLYSKLVSKAKQLKSEIPNWDDVSDQFRDILFKFS